MARRYDVVVIGGGPVGSVAARSAASAGARVLLIERGTSPCVPSPCTGLVSPRTLPALGISESSVVRRIRSIEAHAPNGHRLTLRANAVKGLVLDRSRLHAELHAHARDAGVLVRLGLRATRLEPGFVDVQSPQSIERVEAGVIVVATGSTGTFQSERAFPSPSRLFRAVQAVVEYEPTVPDEVTTYFGNEIAPRFFAWAVPAESGRTRVGLAVPAECDPIPFLDRLLKARFEGLPVRSRLFGRIPIGPVPIPYRDGLLLVGDAAGQVKPLSGGGLYTGAICARIAGRTAARATMSRRTNERDLSTFAADCDRAIGDEVRFGLAARGLLESLSDEAIDDAFEAVDRSDFLRFLAENGDIDRLRRLPRRLAGEPGLWRRLLPLLTLLDRHLAAQAGGSVARSTDNSL